MTSESASRNGSLQKAPVDKSAFVNLAERLLDLQPGSLVVDLDDLQHLHEPPSAELGIWLESWATMVEPLGFEQALDLLFLASSRLENLLFCSESRCTPQAWLPEYIRSERDIKLLFEASTCYQDVIPLVTYKGKTVFWGRNPRFRWDGTTPIDARKLRLATARFRKRP